MIVAGLFALVMFTWGMLSIFFTPPGYRLLGGILATLAVGLIFVIDLWDSSRRRP
jgi:hypothetical protein